MRLAKTDDSLPLLDDFVGFELGSYEIVEVIGKGGMGTIYRARHTRIGRTVAIKLLRNDLVENKLEVERFLNEAKTVNRIGHPNIVDIYDFVEEWDHDPPLIYLVMELLEGCNLNDYLDGITALPVNEAVDIALRICDGLSAVHDVGVMHRDLKPDNVFLTDDPRGGRHIKLLDFGIARGFAEGQSSELTDPGRMVGTPQYMSPEQVLSRPLDARSDIYSLGLVLYKMLTGATPFDAEEVGSVLVDQVHKPAPPALRADGTPVPDDVQQVLTRCLNKAPADRFQTARELRDALADCHTAAQAVQAVQAVQAAPASVQAPLSEAAPVALGGALPRSRGALYAVVVAVVLALGVGGYLLTRSSRGADAHVARGSAAPAGSAGASTGGATTAGALAGSSSAANAATGAATGSAASASASAATGNTATDSTATGGAATGGAAKTAVASGSARARIAAAHPGRKRRKSAHKRTRRPAKARHKAAKAAKAAKKGATKPPAKSPPAETGRKRLKERINRGGTLDPFAN